MSSLIIPIAQHNLHGPDKNRSNREKSIVAFLDAARGGVGGCNEFNKADREFFLDQAARRGLLVAIFDQNALVWDPTKVRRNSITNHLIMRGGPVGADGVPTPRRGDDDRKVGPNRFVVIGNFSPLVDGKVAGDPFEIDCTHLVHQAFTRAKWKLKLWLGSVTKLGSIRRAVRGAILGDMNRGSNFTIPGMPGLRWIKTPGTVGRAAYDKVGVWGGLTVTAVKEFFSPSDHGGVKGLLHIPLWGGADPTPPPITRPVPAPKPQPWWVRQGRPVPYPRRAKWNPARLRRQARRTRNAARRKNLLALASRIAAWRRQNPRRKARR